MARGLPNFTEAFTRPSGNLGSDTRDLTPPTDKLQKIQIISLDIPFRPEVTQLLLNPSSITESKAANWIRQEIPGQSDPLLQWVSGGERVVSFTAFVTKDLADNYTVDNRDNVGLVTLIESDSATSGLEVVNPIASTEGNILSELRQINLDFNITTESRIKQTAFLISIQSNLDYYRSLLMPRKSSRRFQKKTPPLVKLDVGDILGSRNTVAQQKWVLLAYDFNITEYTPDLKPTKAMVNFTFIEYVDRSKEVDAEAINAQLNADSSKFGNVTNVTEVELSRDTVRQSLNRFR